MPHSRIQNWSVAIILLIVACVPWIRFGWQYPTTLVQELDHCPQLACDFSRHYLTQAKFWMQDSTNMDSGWFYPPLLMLLIAPLTQLNDPVLWWTGLNLIGVGCIVLWVSHQIDSSWRYGIAVLLCVSSFPILHAIKWGQISILLTVTILIFLTSRSHWLKSIFLGLAGAIKLYPLVFLLIELLSKRLAVVLSTLLVAVIAGGFIPWMVLGESIEMYWRAVLRGQQMVQDMASMSGGQALAPALHRWFVTGEHIGGQWSLEPLLIGISWLKPICLLSVMGVGIYDGYRMRKHVSSLLSGVYWIVWMHLLLQPGWVHYFCWLPFAQVVVWNRTPIQERWLLVGVGLVERIPILFLSSQVYFSFVRSGGLTFTVLVLWIVTRRQWLKQNKIASFE